MLLNANYVKINRDNKFVYCANIFVITINDAIGAIWQPKRSRH